MDANASDSQRSPVLVDDESVIGEESHRSEKSPRRRVRHLDERTRSSGETLLSFVSEFDRAGPFAPPADRRLSAAESQLEFERLANALGEHDARRSVRSRLELHQHSTRNLRDPADRRLGRREELQLVHDPRESSPLFTIERGNVRLVA